MNKTGQTDAALRHRELMQKLDVIVQHLQALRHPNRVVDDDGNTIVDDDGNVIVWK
jgi:hypothetical protein